MCAQGESGPSGSVCTLDVSQSSGKFRLVAHVMVLGPDCLVVLYGGTKPHVGAVGIGQLRASLKDPQMPAASSSVLTYLGHKEDILAKSMAEELTRRLGRNTVVVAGIHWDHLSTVDIQELTELAQSLLEKIVLVVLGQR